MTIHRDLDQLEKDGFLRKVRGGASMKPSSYFESDYQYGVPLSFEPKRTLSSDRPTLSAFGTPVVQR
jgi:DeoR/GlpR family transcriptional regulator of sugar metabolism